MTREGPNPSWNQTLMVKYDPGNIDSALEVDNVIDLTTIDN